MVRRVRPVNSTSISTRAQRHVQNGSAAGAAMTPRRDTAQVVTNLTGEIPEGKANVQVYLDIGQQNDGWEASIGNLTGRG